MKRILQIPKAITIIISCQGHKEKRAKPNDIPGAPGSLPGNGFLSALSKSISTEFV